MTALENLLCYYNQLSVNDSKKAILRRALPNIRRINQLNIFELADLCYTSPASISRLVKSLGYESYSVFRTKLFECVQRYDYENRFSIDQRKGSSRDEDIVLEAMEYMISAFKENVDHEEILHLADEMNRATSVAIFGYGIRFMESALQSDLIISGIPSDVIIGDNEQIAFANSMTATDLALIACPDAIYSVSPLNKIIHLLSKKGAKIAILSSSDQLPFLDLVDILFTFNGRHTMADSFYIEMLLAAITTVYRKKYVDKDSLFCTE